MKKILLLFLLIAGGCRLKAQQSFQVKGAEANLLPISDSRYLIPQTAYNWNLPQPQLNQPLDTGSTKNRIVYKNGFSDHMPVIALSGDSRMPVKKIGGYYTMPVVNIGGDDAQPIVKSILPAWPAASKH